jgi:hypothetical protein
MNYVKIYLFLIFILENIKFLYFYKINYFFFIFIRILIRYYFTETFAFEEEQVRHSPE